MVIDNSQVCIILDVSIEIKIGRNLMGKGNR